MSSNLISITENKLQVSRRRYKLFKLIVTIDSKTIYTDHEESRNISHSPAAFWVCCKKPRIFPPYNGQLTTLNHVLNLCFNKWPKQLLNPYKVCQIMWRTCDSLTGSKRQYTDVIFSCYIQKPTGHAQSMMQTDMSETSKTHF